MSKFCYIKDGDYMNEYVFNDIKYTFYKGDKTVIDKEYLTERVTDYFKDYDYIFGDVAYNKIRLKGFCDKNNKIYNKTNDIKTVDEYLKNYCAFGCKWFILKKMQ